MQKKLISQNILSLFLFNAVFYCFLFKFDAQSTEKWWDDFGIKIYELLLYIQVETQCVI